MIEFESKKHKKNPTVVLGLVYLIGLIHFKLASVSMILYIIFELLRVTCDRVQILPNLGIQLTSLTAFNIKIHREFIDKEKIKGVFIGEKMHRTQIIYVLELFLAGDGIDRRELFDNIPMRVNELRRVKEEIERLIT